MLPLRQKFWDVTFAKKVPRCYHYEKNFEMVPLRKNSEMLSFLSKFWDATFPKKNLRCYSFALAGRNLLRHLITPLPKTGPRSVHRASSSTIDNCSPATRCCFFWLCSMSVNASTGVFFQAGIASPTFVCFFSSWGSHAQTKNVVISMQPFSECSFHYMQWKSRCRKAAHGLRGVPEQML